MVDIRKVGGIDAFKTHVPDQPEPIVNKKVDTFNPTTDGADEVLRHESLSANIAYDHLTAIFDKLFNSKLTIEDLTYLAEELNTLNSHAQKADTQQQLDNTTKAHHYAVVKGADSFRNKGILAARVSVMALQFFAGVSGIGGASGLNSGVGAFNKWAGSTINPYNIKEAASFTRSLDTFSQVGNQGVSIGDNSLQATRQEAQGLQSHLQTWQQHIQTQLQEYGQNTSAATQKMRNS